MDSKVAESLNVHVYYGCSFFWNIV